MTVGLTAGAPVWTKAPADIAEAYLPGTVKRVEADGATCAITGDDTVERTGV